MSTGKRRPLVVGNWKMNKGPQEADALAVQLKVVIQDYPAVDVGVAPTFLALPAVAERLKHTAVQVVAQNCHPEVSGAYTGEVSPEMLRQLGVTWCLVGHSERRQIFGESDSFVGQKVRGCLRAGVLPILCVGETLAERDAGQAEAVVQRQLDAGLAGLPTDQLASVTIAYEPVWAIGTGRNASPQQAQEIHAFIRSYLEDRYPPFVSRSMRILYGGSVKGSNAAGLLGQADIDGALVGGAALTRDDFVAIVAAAHQRGS